jgi:DNA-binding GntR family transcriptional regulator
MRSSALASRIANEIAGLIRVGRISSGDHLSTQKLGDQFGVSRSPVREALQMLAEQGVLELKSNRGFFVRPLPRARRTVPENMQLLEASPEYQRLADDWLRDRIPEEVTEQFLRERFKLTKGQVTDILVRAAREGWAERKQGYGWRFLPVAKTPKAFEQIYRFRMLIEPAAMLEPGYRVDKSVLAEQRRIQAGVLESDITRLPAEWLLNAGAVFHEELIKFSGNPFFYQALVRVNRMRRLLEYRAQVDRKRLHRQCTEHLQIVGLLERGEVIEASSLMRQHLGGALAIKSPMRWDKNSLILEQSEKPIRTRK